MYNFLSSFILKIYHKDRLKKKYLYKVDIQEIFKII